MSKKTDPIGSDSHNYARRIALQQLKSLNYSGLNLLGKPSGSHVFTALQAADTSAAPAAIESSGAAAASKSTGGAPPPAADATSPAAHRSSAPTLIEQDQLTDYPSDPLDESNRVQRLEVMAAEVAACTRCSELSACRQNTVFGVGSLTPELCFLGEGPGADEDRQGEPFVGAAGQLLNKILQACKMSRDEVYILNTVKCRPPGNRNPSESELENCWPYAVDQLDILQPKFICCLGSVAARTLLKTKQSIGRMRGQFFKYRGSQVLVTYHPAYLLRNPSAKRQVWDDMKMLLAAMGRSL